MGVMDAGLFAFATAMALSTFGLLFLGWTDPKRLGRRTQLTASARVLRFASLALSLFPGIWLLLRQDGGYFLMWLGYITVWGWVVALLLQQRTGKSSSSYR
ncbi:MAG: hypothetical protein AAF346_01980 [Pseudomonadota bacterium]